MKKKIIIRISVISIIILAFFTFLSKTIYGLSLPTVNIIKADKNYIDRSTNTQSNLFYEKAEEIKAGSNWNIQNVFVKPGMEVKKGDLLFDLETEQYEHSKAMLELDILRLQNSIKDLIVTAKSAKLSAPFKGRIINSVKFTIGQTIIENTVLGQIIDESSFIATFPVNIMFKNDFSQDMQVNIILPEFMSECTGTIVKKDDLETVISEGYKVFYIDVKIQNPGVLSQNMTANLNAISTTGESIEATAQLEYANTRVLIAPMTGIITNIYTGSTCPAGSEIIAITQDIGDQSANKARQLEYSKQLEIAQMQLNNLDFPTNGQVFSQTDGFISFFSLEIGDNPEQDTSLIAISLPESELFTKFSLPADQAQYYLKKASIEISYDAINLQTELSEIQMFTTDIYSYKYLPKENTYEFIVKINQPDCSPLTEILANVKVSTIGEMFDSIIPLECISKRANEYYIYIIDTREGLLGNQDFVKAIKVNILDQNDFFAALDSFVYSNYDIVFSSSDSLSDNQRVRIVF